MMDESNPLKVGYAHAPITPMVRMELVGYDYPDRVFDPATDAPLDELFVRVLLVESGESFVVLVVLDLCVVPAGLAEQMRRGVREAVGREDAVVLVCATHTHSAPMACAENDLFRIPQLARDDAQADFVAYGAYVTERAVAACTTALSELEPATASYGTWEADMSYNRRVQTADGIRHCWNPKQRSQLRPDPHPCPRTPLLVLKREQGRPVLLTAPGIHPVCLGKETSVLSADWPGYAHQVLNEAGYDSVLLQGPSAEVHPFRATEVETGAEKEVGERVAHAILEALAELKQIEGETDLDSSELSLSDKPARITTGQLLGLPFASIPGEWFAAEAKKLQQGKELLPLLVTLADGWLGYFPNADVWEEGGYEVEVAKKMGVSPEDTERIRELIR